MLERPQTCVCMPNQTSHFLEYQLTWIQVPSTRAIIFERTHFYCDFVCKWIQGTCSSWLVL